jgi:predicted nucleotidyltransferase
MNRYEIEKTNEYLIKEMPKVLSDDLVKIVMYGSCARGDYSEESDVDIAIFTRCDRITSKKYDDRLMDIVTDIAMDLGTIVQYICIPVTEYEKKKSWYGYFKNIEKEGIVLYG